MLSARSVMAAALAWAALAACVLAARAAAPAECRSYVQLGNLEGKAAIGPAAALHWKVTGIYHTSPPAPLQPQPCVAELRVEVRAGGVPVGEAVLTARNRTLEVAFDHGTAAGAGEIALDGACAYGVGSGVPQLRVQYRGYDGGLRGGMNASVVVFDLAQPDFDADARLVSAADAVAWTACTQADAPVPTLLNATLWVVNGRMVAGAAFVDARNPVQSGAYSIGLLGNLTATFTYSSSGVMADTVACDPSHPCTRNNFQLFSVF